MSIPDNFAFRFGDMPQYLHYADKDEDDVYHISWDRQHIIDNNVDWYACSESDIEGFILEENGWVIE